MEDRGFFLTLQAIRRQADVLAVQIMAKGGYDPEALVRYIGRVQPPPCTGVGEARSPLPKREERVAAMREIIRLMPARSYSPGAEFPSIQKEVRRLAAK